MSLVALAVAPAAAALPLRIGVWFNAAHASYGGPAQVLVGTLLGFLQNTEAEVVIRLNEPGDINWIVDGCGSTEALMVADWGTRGLRRGVGPFVFSHADVLTEDPNTSPVWRLGASQLTLYLAPSLWFGKWIARGLPFYDLRHNRPLVVWGAGVDTDFFRPLVMPKKRHDYFIYFKSQNWTHLREIHEYLFKNYFRLHGPTLMYYFYSHEELREVAQHAACCILLDATETQGLAALEIMACGCPLFVLDTTTYFNERYITKEASSAPCWDRGGRCGMKSAMDRLTEDFPQFLENLAAGVYNPRPFVEETYSWKAAAAKLRLMLETLPSA